MHDYSKITEAVKKTEAQIWENSIAMERMKNSFERELSAIYNSRSWKSYSSIEIFSKVFKVRKRVFLNLIVNFREPFQNSRKLLLKVEKFIQKYSIRSCKSAKISQWRY